MRKFVANKTIGIINKIKEFIEEPRYVLYIVLVIIAIGYISTDKQFVTNGKEMATMAVEKVYDQYQSIDKKVRLYMDLHYNHQGVDLYQQGMTLLSQQRFVDSVPFFKKSAELNYPPAFVRLAWLHSVTGLAGQFIPGEYCHYKSLSYSHLDTLIEQAERNPQESGWACLVGMIHYFYGNSEAAEFWFQKAGDLGDVIALNAMGYFSHRRGDRDEAKRYFFLAADKGFALAQYNLGLMYFHEPNRQLTHEILAVHYFELAHSKKFAQAELSLASCYEWGIGVKQNLHIAKVFYDLASANTNLPEAREGYNRVNTRLMKEHNPN